MLKGISIYRFRNYEKVSLRFFKGAHVFIGDNAQGKSNLLEAIYYCMRLKSFRSVKTKDMIYFSEKEFLLRSYWEYFGTQEKIELHYNKVTNKRSISSNQEKILSTVQYLKNKKCIYMSNEDVLLISKNSSDRREFMDQWISMVSQEYKATLKAYEKIYNQRKKLLHNSKISLEMDKIYADISIKLMRARRNFIKTIEPSFQQIYKSLLGEDLLVEIKFKDLLPELDMESFLNELEKKREIDLLTKRNNFGAHRESPFFYINNQEVKLVGSQAQIKLFVYAFKLSIYEYCVEKLKINPIILLDDVLSDLDPHRIHRFFQILSKCQQFFLTVANKDLIISYLKEGHFYSVEGGRVNSYDEQR